MLTVCAAPAQADLRSAPVWWDPDGVGAGQDWHYRVPITVPAGATINSTIKLDVNFVSLLAAMGVTGTFDANSPRVVRSTGALSTNQEFTDAVYAGATDTTGDGKGEVRFILEDAGPATYYLYFDITQNGIKSANPQVPINGNFEQGGDGTALPPGWAAASKLNAVFDTQISASNSYSITTNGGGATPATKTTDGTALTGNFSYLIGSRTNNEPASGAAVNVTTLDKSFTVPVSAAGNLVVRWRPEGWDSDGDGISTQWDFITITIVDTTANTSTQIVGPAYGNYNTAPYTPNYSTAQASATNPGYAPYNGYDMDTSATHAHYYTTPLTVAYGAEPWWTRTVSLAPYAGHAITLRFNTSQTQPYRSWYSIDDVEWSVVSASLGTPQAWGINITAPLAGANLTPGQVVPLTVVVDAAPTAASNTMTVNLYDNTGALVVSGVVLTKTAGNTWSSATGLTIPGSAVPGTVWTLRAFGLDASTTSISGVTSGLAHIPAAANTMNQTDFYNIDEITANIVAGNISVTKISSITSDPVNGTTSPKLIPGAIVHYCILVKNNGPATATAVTITDPIPTTVTFVAGSMFSGTSCASVPTGQPNPAGTTITVNAGTMANASTYAVVFDVRIN